MNPNSPFVARARQVQVTLDGSKLLNSKRTMFQVSSKDLQTKRRRLMSACCAYIQNCGNIAFAPTLEQVQLHMLSGFGLSSQATSSLLHDLARIGKIGLLNNRITLGKITASDGKLRIPPLTNELRR
jgi:hypothetical protein